VDEFALAGDGCCEVRAPLGVFAAEAFTFRQRAFGLVPWPWAWALVWFYPVLADRGVDVAGQVAQTFGHRRILAAATRLALELTEC
jgi:hypothetical protein